MKSIGFGRFVTDPELTPVNDTYVCRFTLCIDEWRKTGGERKKFPNFFDFVVWDKAAEVISKYGEKGRRLYFVASARQEKWKDKESGGNRSKVVFRIEDFQFLDSQNGGNNTPTNESNESQDVTNEQPGEEVPF